VYFGFNEAEETSIMLFYPKNKHKKITGIAIGKVKEAMKNGRKAYGYQWTRL
jgi:hypothetical protein